MEFRQDMLFFRKLQKHVINSCVSLKLMTFLKCNQKHFYDITENFWIFENNLKIFKIMQAYGTVFFNYLEFVIVQL